MLKQLRYFEAVVSNKSFSKAAEECYISQSAISQQIQALERELGVELLKREGRSFSLTPAGELLYRKGRSILKEWDGLVKEIRDIGGEREEELRLGCLRSYTGSEFYRAVTVFSQRYPRVELRLTTGNHEELYQLLVSGQIDLLLSDQRRAFSDSYFNEVLAARPYHVEVAAHHPIARHDGIDVAELREFPCILVCSPDQREVEAAYYRDSVGLSGSFLYAPNLEEGRLLAASGKGVLLVEGGVEETSGMGLRQIPLARHGQMIFHNYCVFWNRENKALFLPEFAELLKAQF